MPFNGAGMFVRLRNWVADAAAGIKIRADYHDLEDDGFADGLSHCITRDGQSVVLQNIPMNGKRLTALADPIDPQDAATRAYADTMVDGAGDTMTGDLTIKKASPSLLLNGVPGGENKIVSQKSDKNRWLLYLGNSTAESGSNAGSDFYLANCNDAGTVINYPLQGMRSTSLLTVAGDPTNVLGISTKRYTDNTVNAMGALKLSLTGGTITGGLTVNGELVAVQNYLRFSYPGSPGYISWQGGSTYYLGEAGYIWHGTNLATPVINGRLQYVADVGTPWNNAMYEPYGGCVVTGLAASGTGQLLQMRLRTMQLQTPGGWYTVGYV